MIKSGIEKKRFTVPFAVRHLLFPFKGSYAAMKEIAEPYIENFKRCAEIPRHGEKSGERIDRRMPWLTTAAKGMPR